MKHIKNFRLFESAGLNEEQTQFLNKFFRNRWSINPSTGLIDVDREDLAFKFRFDHSTPKGIKYGVFKGDFEFDNELTPVDLAGLPREVIGNFVFLCSKDIDSLKGLPEIVTGFVRIRGYSPLSTRTCSIGSLEGLPKKIGESFIFEGDKLDSLQGFHTNIRGKVSITINKNESLGFKVDKGKAYLLSAWYWVGLMLTKYVYTDPKIMANTLSLGEANELIKLFSTLYTLDDFKRESEKKPQENPYLKSEDFPKFLNTFITRVFTKMDKKEKECFLPFTLDNLTMLIEKDPEVMMIKLSGVWNHPDFADIKKKIAIPSRYEEEMDTLGDLSDLGF
jgi:hypothetical protein